MAELLTHGGRKSTSIVEQVGPMKGCKDPSSVLRFSLLRTYSVLPGIFPQSFLSGGTCM